MDKFLELQNQAQYEQAMAAIKQLADVLHEYHERLLAQGFSKKQAFELTLAMQGHLIQQGKDQMGGA